MIEFNLFGSFDGGRRDGRTLVIVELLLRFINLEFMSVFHPFSK